MAHGRAIPDIFTNLMRHLGTLMRAEAQLARAETSENISQIGMAFGLVIAGAILIIPGLVLLLEAAASTLLKAGMEDYWAQLIVGGTATVIALLLAAIGGTRFKTSRLIPSKTIEQIQHDAGVVIQQMESDQDATRPTA
jgi:hypothetical protein